MTSTTTSATSIERRRRALVLAGSGFAGATLFGLYLFLALNVLRMHHNEAFSALSWPHHKSFLRCRVLDVDRLEVRAIGVERTAVCEGQHPVAVHEIERVIVDARPPSPAPATT